MAPSPDSSDDDPSSDCWRAALWILEALPPSRKVGAAIPPLRRRKLTRYLYGVVNARGPSGTALLEPVAGNASFLAAFMWWIDRRGIEDEILLRLSSLQSSAGNVLIDLAGTLAGAHAILVAFAEARAATRDAIFSEAEIRAATLRQLVGPCSTIDR